MQNKMSLTTESIDPYLTTALKLLHSSANDSAEKIRLLLDSEISKTFNDKNKTITNTVIMLTNSFFDFNFKVELLF